MSLKISELAALLVEYAELPEFEATELSSVHDRGRWDSMPLHIAIHRKRPGEVKVFLAAGADPNAPGEYGERPLHIAVRRGLFEIAEMLLRAGAQCDLRDGDGNDIWRQAELSGVKERLQQIDQSVRNRTI